MLLMEKISKSPLQYKAFSIKPHKVTSVIILYVKLPKSEKKKKKKKKKPRHSTISSALMEKAPDHFDS
jgi:hypothetical protein